MTLTFILERLDYILFIYKDVRNNFVCICNWYGPIIHSYIIIHVCKIDYNKSQDFITFYIHLALAYLKK